MKSKERQRLLLETLIFLLSFSMVGCRIVGSNERHERDLYSFMSDRISGYRGESLRLPLELPILLEGWSIQEDENGFIGNVENPNEFERIDKFFREVLGDPFRQSDNRVMYHAKDVGVMVSYEKFEGSDEGVNILVLRPLRFSEEEGKVFEPIIPGDDERRR